MESPRAILAEDHARALSDRPWVPVAPVGTAPARAVLLGDPQTSLPRFMTILDHHGLLGPDGTLAPDTALVSVGDHFDYGTGDRGESARDGQALLRWLADHPPDRVVILAGNHDLARVTEMAMLSDQDFLRARIVARAAMDGDPRAEVTFHRDFPDIPTPEVAWRDYGAFTVAQRVLVQSLLRAGRMHLARALRLTDGTPVLVTHAGVTQRELGLLGLPPTVDVPTLAAALEQRFRAAVASVAPVWSQGGAARLPLEPLHVVGTGGREGGGMLYHRPGARQGPDDPRFGSHAPRRFEPHALPRGLVQAVGHSGHARNRKDLTPWATQGALAVERGGLRTLRTVGEGAVYEMGITVPDPTEATLYLVDGEMHHVPVTQVPVLPLDPASLTTAP